MPNLFMFLLAEMFAKRRRESGGDALRVALPAMFLSSPLGLVVAIALANRDAPPATIPKVAPPPPPPPAQGLALLGAVGALGPAKRVRRPALQQAQQSALQQAQQTAPSKP
jgi:hypothetical protein